MAALAKVDGTQAVVPTGPTDVRAVVAQFEEISRKQAARVGELGALVARGAARLQETEEKLERALELVQLQGDENTGLRQENTGLRAQVEGANALNDRIFAIWGEIQDLRQGIRLDEQELAEYRSWSARASRAAQVVKKSARELAQQAEEFVDDVPRGVWNVVVFMNPFREDPPHECYLGGRPYSRERYLTTRIQEMQRSIWRREEELDRLRALKRGGEAAPPP